MKKRLSLFLAVLMLVPLLASCNSKTPGASPSASAGASESGEPSNEPTGYTPPASDVVGEISLMTWSGDGSYIEDIGHKDLKPEDITGTSQAQAYAVAKAFNEIYPNVKINVYAKAEGPNDEAGTWIQHIENFRLEHGKYPDVYSVFDMADNIKRGMLADISIFSDDPVYQSINPGVMNTMSFDGHLFGLPVFLQPWGVFVNRTLAASLNVDIPEPDWTIEEYTDFIAHSEKEVYYGANDADLDIVTSSTLNIGYQLNNRKEGEPYVNFNTEEFFKLLELVPKWSQNALWPQYHVKNVSQAWVDEYWSWDFYFFVNGKLLVDGYDPWMMGDAANPTEGHPYAAQFDDWDIYPRPSNADAGVGNHVGAILDAYGIHNYAMDDGNPAISDEEYQKTQIAYEFTKFWTMDTRAWEARANQQYLQEGVLTTAFDDSLPVVTGEEFDKQMTIWYSVPQHQRYADAVKMPGWQYVMQLWEEGQFWDYQGKIKPSTYEYEGELRDILYEWYESFRFEDFGVARTDANWVDTVKSRIPDWNAAFNERYENEWKLVMEAVEKYGQQ